MEYFLRIRSAKYTRTSQLQSKISLFSSIIATIISSYAIIHPITILRIYLRTYMKFDNLFLWSPSSLFESPQKTGITFS